MPTGNSLRSEPVIRLVPDHRLQTRRSGTVLVAHHPVTVMRLAPKGGQLVRGWFAGTPVAPNPLHRALAHRLVAGGYAHYHIAPGEEQADEALSVVIPVKDDPGGLDDTLEALTAKAGAGQLLEIIVVDDASRPPVERHELHVGSSVPTTVVDSPLGTGPAAARNRGLSTASGSVVAFVDAGVTVTADQLHRLANLVRQPGVVAAAPRIATSPGAGRIDRYERSASPIDMGVHPAVVAPGRPVTYVPTGCLVVRADAINDAGGFDQALRFGEDVDLVWRLNAQGLVLYQPEVIAHHRARATLARFARQRFEYGTAAGPLAARHGPNLAPVALSPRLVAVVAAGHIMGGRRGALVVGALTLAERLRRLRQHLGSVDDAAVESTLLLGRDVAGRLDGFLAACARPWSPVLVMAAVAGGGAVRRRAATILLAAAIRQLISADTNDPVDALLGAVDDLAYSAGVVCGAVRSGQPSPLLPKFGRRQVKNKSSS